MKLKTLIRLAFPLVLGSLGGFLYYNFIGCNGSCAITSSAANSTAYGALIGLILTDWKTIKKLFKKEN